MAQPSVPPLDFARLLAAPGGFFEAYWQKQPLTLDLAPADFAALRDAVGSLDIARLADLARGGTQAWLANDYVAHSVIAVDAANAGSFFAEGATLYFLDVPLPRLTQPLADFLGAPHKKLLASFFLTPASGGATRHFDAHENFTIQLTGAKRWIVGDAPAVIAPPDGHVQGHALAPSLAGLMPGPAPETEHAVDLQPGRLLYVPRGTYHRTGAGETSWSLNLSYGCTMWLDLLNTALRRRLSAAPGWRASVSQGALPLELLHELRALLADPAEVERLARDFLARPEA